MLSASSRSSLAVPHEFTRRVVAVEATSRPRQFGYETPQLRLERRLHAGSPYRSNDLVSAGPEPPLSCDLRLNHAANRNETGRKTHTHNPRVRPSAIRHRNSDFTSMFESQVPASWAGLVRTPSMRIAPFSLTITAKTNGLSA